MPRRSGSMGRRCDGEVEHTTQRGRRARSPRRVRHSLWHPTPPGCYHHSLLAQQGYGGLAFATSYSIGGITVSFCISTITGNVAQQVSMRQSVMSRCMQASGSAPIDAMAPDVVERECLSGCEVGRPRLMGAMGRRCTPLNAAEGSSGGPPRPVASRITGLPPPEPSCPPGVWWRGLC